MESREVRRLVYLCKFGLVVRIYIKYKRYIKSPKYYFIETGLLSYLLDIQEPHQLVRDPLCGHVFENLVVMECLKSQFNKGIQTPFYFLKDSNHNEVDLLFQKGRYLYAFGIKSAGT